MPRDVGSRAGHLSGLKRDNIEPINKIYGLLVLNRSVQSAELAVNCSAEDHN